MHKPNSIFEAAYQVLAEVKQKSVKSIAVGDKVMPRDVNNLKPKTLKQKIANRNNYFKLVFDDGSDVILHGDETYKLAEGVEISPEDMKVINDIKKVFPSGSKINTWSGTLEWRKSGGYAGEKSLKTAILQST